MKTYRGLKFRDFTVVVEEDGDSRVLSPRRDLINHSPTGFAWGYGGSGPAQLALALLADLSGDDEYALANYQEFKWYFVAHLDGFKGWSFTVEAIQKLIDYNKGRAFAENLPG